MFYYLSLLRFHIANQHHIRTRKKFDNSWKHLIETRRTTRVLSNKNFIEQLKYYLI